MGLHCPKCGSSRVRRGYERPSLPLRLIGMHGLLCDNCNLSYRGFAFPGTVPEHTKRKSRYYRRVGEAREQEQLALEQEQASHPAWSHHEGAQPAQVFSFMRYYLKLRVKVLLGLHNTTHSLGIKYRWRNWQRQQRSKDS